MPENQLVSIIMNCYNGEKYLREALDSIIDQTYKNWELIFWDNQSTDNSANIVLSYNDHRIKYFYSKTHTLLYEARNLAIEKSQGGYLAFLDVDDYWDLTKLEKQMLVFSKNSEVAIVYSNLYFKNEIKNTFKKLYKKKLPEGMIVDELLRKNFMGLLTVLLNRRFIDEKEKVSTNVPDLKVKKNLTDSLANRDFIYFLFLMAIIGRVDIFIFITAFGSNIFAAYLTYFKIKSALPAS